MTQSASKEEKLALVLSGGGSLGSIQVGCIEALLEQGLVPDLIVGTSVGAINGAWLAKYPTLEGMARLKKMWLSQGQGVIFSESRVRQLLRLFIGRNYLHTNRFLRRLLCQYMHCSTTFEELVVPLYITAANLEAGELGVFNRGSLMPAILASTATPGILKPVVINGITYVDGAIISNCSIETALSSGATTIVAIECPHPRPSKGYGILDILKQASWVSLGRLCHLERERFHERCNLVVLEPDIGTLNQPEISDFSDTRRFIEMSKLWARQFISSGNSTALRNLIQHRKSSHTIIQTNLTPSEGNTKALSRSCSSCEWCGWCGECG